MKYEAPELNALTAINTIQTQNMQSKKLSARLDMVHPGTPVGNEPSLGYADWE
jgi:hypothetical protein